MHTVNDIILILLYVFIYSFVSITYLSPINHLSLFSIRTMSPDDMMTFNTQYIKENSVTKSKILKGKVLSN